MSEFDGLARAGGAADNTGLSNSLKSGGIPTANVTLWRSACPNPKSQKENPDRPRSGAPCDRHPNGQIGATLGRA